MRPNPSQTDELTGLFNRKAFLEELETALTSIEEENPMAVALLDIDSFLQVNERFGHTAGDAVIKRIAQVIQEQAGENTVVARYGGDEFVVLFQNTEREQAFLTMERVRSEVEKCSIPFAEGQPPVNGITSSGGVAAFPLDGRSSAEILRKADQALYRAKETGRNKIRLAYEERMIPKTTHFTLTQLERLSKLANQRSASEAELLREALDELLNKYGVTGIER